MISPRVLERRESGKNLSDSVTEQSDDSSVTQDDPFDARFFRCIPPKSFGGGRKGTIYIMDSIFIVSRAPERKKGGGTIVVTIGKINDYKEPTILYS